MALLRPSSFWRDVSPRGAVADFATVFRQAGRHRWRIAAVSAACTFAVFSVMWHEEEVGPPLRPKVTYIKSWKANRSDAEIEASNLENEKRKEILAAAEAKRAEEVRDLYKALGRASGMDVDAIERKAEAERAEEAAQAAAEKKAAKAPAATLPADSATTHD